MALNRHELNKRFKHHLWSPLEQRGVILQKHEKAKIREAVLAKLEQSNPRVPYALLVWLLKNKTAEILEQKSKQNKKKAKTERNILGEEVLSTNVFAKLGGMHEGKAKASREQDS